MMRQHTSVSGADSSAVGPSFALESKADISDEWLSNGILICIIQAITLDPTIHHGRAVFIHF